MTTLWLLIAGACYLVGRKHGRKAVTNEQFYNPELWIAELKKRADHYEEAGI